VRIRDKLTGRNLPIDANIVPLIISDYMAGKKMREIAHDRKINQSTVHRYIHLAGVRPRPLGQRYSYNKNAFDSITEESAYWAGFLMADGCIASNNSGTKVIALSIKDSDSRHVEKFKRFLGCSHPIHTVKRAHGSGELGGGDRAAIRVSSNELASSLEKFGVVARKSLIATARGGMESNRHFWRGVVDGDGTVASMSSNRLQLSIFSAGKIAHQFVNYIQGTLRIKGKIYSSKRSDRRAIIHKATYVGKEAAMVASLLYDDQSISLDRKNENAKWWINVFDSVLSGRSKTLPRGFGWRARKK